MNDKTENERLVDIIEVLAKLIGELTGKIYKLDERLRVIEKWAVGIAKGIMEDDAPK